MKLKQIITGCALVAGLLAFAPVKSQATVYQNYLVSPFTFKVVGTYVGAKNKLQKVTFTNKDVLNYYFGGTPPNGVILALWDGDVVIYNRLTTLIVADLTTDNVLYANLNEYTYNNYYQKNGFEKYLESGAVEIGYYSNGNQNALDLNDYAFDVYGTYTYIGTVSYPVNGYWNSTESFKTSNLSGEAYDGGYISSGIVQHAGYDYLPATGTANYSGAGVLSAFP